MRFRSIVVKHAQYMSALRVFFVPTSAFVFAQRTASQPAAASGPGYQAAVSRRYAPAPWEQTNLRCFSGCSRPTTGHQSEISAEISCGGEITSAVVLAAPHPTRIIQCTGIPILIFLPNAYRCFRTKPLGMTIHKHIIPAAGVLGSQQNGAAIPI